jgi:hypothetical protein
MRDNVMYDEVVGLFSNQEFKRPNVVIAARRLAHLLGAFLLATSLSSLVDYPCARAELVANHTLPQFTQPQLQIIMSDGLLRAALSDAPWLLLQALQIGACSAPGGEGRGQPAGGGECPPSSSASASDDWPEDRANPEAAYDLFMLLKKVKETQNK